MPEIDGDFFVRFDEVAGTASGLARLAREATTSYTALLGGFSAFTAPWGGGGPGQAFFAVYADAAQQALGNAVQVPHQVDALAGNMKATVESYQSTEAANSAAARRVEP